MPIGQGRMVVLYENLGGIRENLEMLERFGFTHFHWCYYYKDWANLKYVDVIHMLFVSKPLEQF